jgi:hypothetical protein
MPSKEDWIDAFTESLEVANATDDKERASACEAELKALGVNPRQKAVKAPAENTSKS